MPRSARASVFPSLGGGSFLEGAAVADSRSLGELFLEGLAVDLVILDVMMPGFSGLRVCEEIRKRSTVPILFLTALAQDSDKLVGLTAGGDDYLTKPFSYSELIARVKALLRRYCVYRGKPGRRFLPPEWCSSLR